MRTSKTLLSVLLILPASMAAAVEFHRDVMPVIADRCMNCHAATSEGDDRYGAPPGVDLDTHADVLAYLDRIEARVSVDSPTMPPVGGADREERERLAEWLACGAP